MEEKQAPENLGTEQAPETTQGSEAEQSTETTIFADAMAFLGWPGDKPQLASDLKLDLAHVTCAPPKGPVFESFTATLKAINTFRGELERCERRARIARSKSDLEGIGKDDSTRIVLGIQNIPNFAHSAKAMKELWDAGVRVVSLCYDQVNRYGSGCLNLDIGITDAGREMISWLADIGFILDLSRSGHRMARETLDCVFMGRPLPVMASHCGLYSVFPYLCNLPDDVLKRVAGNGGVVGISNSTHALHQVENTTLPFRSHLMMAVRKFGISSVVIGSDAPYISYTEEEEREVFEGMKNLIDPEGTRCARFPAYLQFLKGPDRMPRIEAWLKSEFTGDAAIEKVVGQNLLNFFRRSLPT